MKMRQACAYILMAGGILLFAGSPIYADQTKTGAGSTGGSSGSMKQGQKSDHESSGKMNQDSSVITPDNPGGIVTRGGRGEVPSSSKVDPLNSDQRESGSGFSPSGTSGNAPGVTGSSGADKSSGGTGTGGAGGK